MKIEKNKITTTVKKKSLKDQKQLHFSLLIFIISKSRYLSVYMCTGIDTHTSCVNQLLG